MARKPKAKPVKNTRRKVSGPRTYKIDPGLEAVIKKREEEKKARFAKIDAAPKIERKLVLI